MLSRPVTARRGSGRGSRRDWILGVDTGGTFTDIMARCDTRTLALKLPSTPDNPARAILEGVRRVLEMIEREVPPPGGAGRTLRLVHGSTVATNTILERKGARTAFVTTRGFRDLVEIGRQNRPGLYDLSTERVTPIVPRARRHEVAERIDADGRVLVPLDPSSLDAIVTRLRRGTEAVAVGFLFSYLDPAHEETAARVIEHRLPGVPVTISSSISPEMREYERFSTAILNAYVAPRMTRYLDTLEKNLPAASIEIMGSGGGTVPIERSRAEPVGTVLSGPAAGVLGARRAAAAVGVERVITFDMGGTSTDVSLVDRDPSFRNESEIGGLPLRLPTLDVHTVGAGGGSIARLDPGGGLRVGPQSAGADPGPAVYGRGRQVTVTDAHVYLGHLGADSFVGGAMTIHPGRADPLIERLACRAGLAPVELARGILEVVNAEMERAIRVVSQQRGHDPRLFTLVAFGGASGLHAAAMARNLLIPRVLVPPEPGILCATGMLDADRIRWRARTVQDLASSCPPGRLRKIAAELRSEALLDFPGIPARRLRTETEIDLRFRGQTHVLTQPFSIASGRSDYEREFRRRYGESFGEARDSWEVEVVTVRVAVRHPRTQPQDRRPAAPGARHSSPPSPSLTRDMVLEDGPRRRVPVYQRSTLRPGHRIAGPAVIAEYSGTTLCPPDYELTVDSRDNLVLTPTRGRRGQAGRRAPTRRRGRARES